MALAAQACIKFRRLLDRYEVSDYYAVATSAMREAENRDALIERARREAAIIVNVIGAEEEARFVRHAVFAAAGGRFVPRVILDIGGGSLEMSFLRGRKAKHAIALPLGTVRLMEMFQLTGALTAADVARLKRHVLSLLRPHTRTLLKLGRGLVVACGGNSEALSELAPGLRVAGFNTVDLKRLSDRLWEIANLGLDGRMETLGVRRDRAEVIGIAAVVLHTVSQWLGAQQLIVPGVGVREGILHDLAAAHFGPASAHDERAEALRQQARRFAARMHTEAAHCEHVRRLAAHLFDQLTPIHDLPAGQRVQLELGALLHDVGLAVNARAHHKHGEYLVRNADIPGFGGHQQTIVACIVRYHGKATPEPHHRLYRSLAPSERRRVRQLAAILRIAVALDAERTQGVRRVETRVQGKTVLLRIISAQASNDMRELRRKVRYFEKQFGVDVRLVQVQTAKVPLTLRSRIARHRGRIAARQQGRSVSVLRSIYRG
jgi:exopolyphosphatase/guanosine-5'-triphosphate,3'-diphosphate pyrophosphatase